MSETAVVKTRGYVGVCRCRACKKTNPWRSCYQYMVAGSPGSEFANTAIMPGFAGRCRFCTAQDVQDVVAITETIEEATAQADPFPEPSEKSEDVKP